MRDQPPTARRGSWRPARLTAVLLVALGCRSPAPAALVLRGPPAASGVAAGWTPARCRALPGAPVDADRDRLDDGCELALARAFAPELLVDPTECLWRADARPPRLAGGYLLAVHPIAPTAVRIAYLPAYARDCGWDGTLCRLRPGGCGAHAGDSELIVVDAASNAEDQATWRTTGVFLSAHCGGRSAGRCRWFRGAALARFAWADDRVLGAPRVWVARGKHAHYPTRRDCDRGHWSYDACARAPAAVRFPVVAAGQNVGSRAHPLPAPDGCRTAAALPTGVAGLDPAARECVWDAARPFRGWQADAGGRGPTSYARHLAEIAGL
jgi:hypothetical protein